ncbi:MAG: iron ABC transporter permease [Bacteroidales bacterium]|nr:iron ABC transporter permease [Bacteroidales bacterium]
MNPKYLKWLLQIIAIAVFAVIALLISFWVGEIKPSWRDLADLLAGNEGGIELSILRQIRLPRIILGFAIGAALSLAGTILQGVYRNPLVEPYTLGISGGAALGVALAIVFDFQEMIGRIMLPVSGFIGAFISLLIVYNISISKGKIKIQTMLLIGVMFSYVASSVMMLLLSVITAEDMQNVVFWTMGSLDEPDNLMIDIAVFLSFLGLFISYIFVHPMNAMRLGHEKARHLGINTETSTRILFITASILTGMAVSIAGVIGFVGLIIPHVIRMLVGSDNRILLITSFIGGGAFLVLCDTLARTIILPNELPTGVITGIIGGIIFVVVISRKDNKMKMG